MKVIDRQSPPPPDIVRQDAQLAFRQIEIAVIGQGDRKSVV